MSRLVRRAVLAASAALAVGLLNAQPSSADSGLLDLSERSGSKSASPILDPRPPVRLPTLLVPVTTVPVTTVPVTTTSLPTVPDPTIPPPGGTTPAPAPDPGIGANRIRPVANLRLPESPSPVPDGRGNDDALTPVVDLAIPDRNPDQRPSGATDGWAPIRDGAFTNVLLLAVLLAAAAASSMVIVLRRLITGADEPTQDPADRPSEPRLQMAANVLPVRREPQGRASADTRPQRAGTTATRVSGHAPPTTGTTATRVSGHAPPTTGTTATRVSGQAPPTTGTTATRVSGHAPPTTGTTATRVSGHAPPTAGTTGPPGGSMWDTLDLSVGALSARFVPQTVINTQNKRRVWRAKSLCAGADVIGIVAALGLAAFLVGDGGIAPAQRGVPQNYFAVAMLSLPCWLLAFSNLRLYMSRFTADRMEEFRRIVHACLFGAMSLAVVGLAVNANVAREWPALVFCFAVVFVEINREIVRWCFARLRRTGHLQRRVLVVGANAEGSQLCSWLLRDTSLGYEVLGFIDDAVPVGETVDNWSVLGQTKDTIEAVRRTGATGVIIATTAVDSTISNRLARDLLSAGIHVELSSSLCDIAADRLSVRSLGRFPMLYVEPVPRNGWRPLAKRAFDVSIAAATLVVTAPLFIAAAITITLDSRGPVFFRQERIGENGKRFRCLKFRTMVVEAEQFRAELEALNEAGSGFFKISHDRRVTRVGRFLRKSSIDELPQLLNVIRGEMSLVGPRPLPVRDVIAHWGPFMEQRLLARPGITGLWQVSGRSSANPADYERLDLYYVDNWSLITDVTILLRTIPAVLLRRGAS